MALETATTDTASCPGHDSNYKHADRGYDPRSGNKNDYKAYYRQAYEQGYQQGYNSNPWRR